jgi:hypothetical protein
MPFMNDTWRFIIVVALLVVLGGVLPFAVDAQAFHRQDHSPITIH